MSCVITCALALLLCLACFRVGCSRRIKLVLQQQQLAQRAKNLSGSGKWNSPAAQASLIGAAAEEAEARGDGAAAEASKGASLHIRPIRRRTIKDYMLGTTGTIAEAKDQKPTMVDRLITFADSGDAGVSSSSGDGIFDVPGNARLGCTLGDECLMWEHCYPKQLHWTVGDDQHQTFNIGTCQPRLVVYAIASVTLFVVGACGCACLRFLLLGCVPEEYDAPALMSTRAPIHLKERAFKPAVEAPATTAVLTSAGLSTPPLVAWRQSVGGGDDGGQATAEGLGPHAGPSLRDWETSD